jgi:hypothetical protein
MNSHAQQDTKEGKKRTSDLGEESHTGLTLFRAKFIPEVTQNMASR